MHFYDRFDSESLAMGYHLPGAGTPEKAGAAKIMADKGIHYDYIAMRLGVSTRQVTRFVNEWEVVPLPLPGDDDSDG